MKPLPAMKNQVNQDWVAQGDKFVDAKQYADAIASYDKALAQNPLNSLAWNGKGRALYLERKYDAAIKCFDRALVINPQDHNILGNRVDVLLSQGKVDEAIQCYDKIIHANPNDKIAWNQKTCALEKLKKYEEAIGCCDELLKIDPSDIGVVIDKARMLIILRNYSEAMKCYDDILKIDPSHVEAASNKGRILVLIGKTDEALKWYDDRLATNPTMTVLHMRKGIAFAMQGQHEQALSCYDEILKINKNDKTTSVYKGISLLFLHQLQESFDHLKVAPKAKEALHVGVLALGIYNIAQKGIRIDFCDIRAYGISDYSERLLQLEYWFYRGLLFSSIKLYSDAAEAYQKLLSLDPSHVRAKKELAAILKFTAPEVLLQPDSVLEELQSHESNFIRHDQLKIKKRLASGGYGEVFLGTWSPTKLKPITVAVKQLKTEMMNAKVWKEFLQEVNIQSKLNSIGLVALLGITGEAPFYMVLEFMGKGSLRDVLIAAKIPHNLSWEERLRMASNIGIGLAYLHSQKPPVIHRDIKSLNVFVNDEGEAKLGDFGLSSAKSESQTQSLAEMNADGILRVKGSLRWLAPELLDPALLPEELSAIRGKYTPATDIFSFATVLREMASHELPYCNAGGNENLIVYYITTGKTEKFDEVTTPNTPTEYSDLVNRCWNMNPSLRPTAEIIVKELTALSDRYNASPTLFKSKNPLKAALKKAAPARPAPQPTKKLVAMSYMTNTRRGTVSAPAAVALDASQRKSEITLQPEGTEVAKVVLK